MERLARIVAGKPLLVLALWLAAALLAAPLFARLHSVVQTQQYSLPPGSEAVKAEELLKAIRGAQASPGIIIVDGFPVRPGDREAIVKAAVWGARFNASLYRERLGSNPAGVPIMLAEANRTIYERLLANITRAAEELRRLHGQLLNVSAAYQAALLNATASVERLVNASRMIAEADAAYVNATRQLARLARGMLEAAGGLRRLDAAYVNATNAILEAASRLNETARLVAAVDAAYSRLLQDLREAAGLAELLGNRSLVEQVLQGLAVSWWQAARTYKIMEMVDGNYTRYLELANLSSLSTQAPPPLPKGLAEAVWRNITALTAAGADPDEAAVEAALVLLSTENREAARLARLLAPLWLEQLHAAAGRPAVALLDAGAGELAEAQLRLLQYSLEAAARAAEAVASAPREAVAGLLSERLASEGVPPGPAQRLALEAASGSVNTTLAALAAVKLVEARANLTLPPTLEAALASTVAEADPRGEGLLAADPGAALEAAARLLEAAGAPGEVVEAARKLLTIKGGGRVEAARLAAGILSQRLGASNATLVEVVERYDPEARGALLSNETLLVEAVVDLVYRVSPEAGRLPRSLALELARMLLERRVDPETAAAIIARHLVFEEMLRRLGPGGEDAAKLVLEALSRYDPNAEGTLARNETLALQAVLELAPKAGGAPSLAPGELVVLARNETALRLTVLARLEERVLAQAPPEARSLLEAYFRLLRRYGPSVPEDAVWGLLRNATLQRLESSAALPRGAAERLADAVVAVARGAESPEAAAARLAVDVLVESVAPRLLNETRGLLVARDYNGFLIVFSPAGGDREERAGSILRAAGLAERLLAEVGAPRARVLATGSDLVMRDVHEYALRDVEKTSRISEAATFLVLLLILESLFAVILPYTGIVMGLLVGGALVYLAARQGIISLDSTAQSLMITTALGLGADYAAYLVHRFREEVAKGAPAGEAAAHALSRAGPAVLASALTVMIGFGSLLLGWDLAFLRSLGETIPVTVAATAAASLTLVPALLALLGGRRWFWWPRRPSRGRHAERESRLLRSLHRHAAVVVAALALLMLAGGYFYATFRGSHDMKLMLPADAPSVKAFELLRDEYMPGVTDPVYIVLRLPGSVYSDDTSRRIVEAVASAVEAVDGVGKVVTPLDNPSLASRDGRVAAIEVVLAVDPYSDEGTAAVEAIHEAAHREAERGGAEAYLGGAPYAVLEMDRLLHDRFYWRILPAAAALMVLVFTAIFGSLTASLAALAVIMGSAFIGIAASVLVFRDLLGQGVPWFLHVVSLIAVMGVGMDYNSFFLARALEECRRSGCGDTETPLARAVGAVGLFIVGLSLVVSSAYLSLLAASSTGMKAMGFTLGLTILLAGVMAGYLFTPLVVALLGEKAWWPWGLRRRASH